MPRIAATTNQTHHDTKVADIQAQIKRFWLREEKFRIYHGSTNSTRNNTKDPNKLVDISRLTDVLEVNTTERYVRAEANVPMDTLVDATMDKGFMPAVVPELPSITIGGAVQGSAGESSSFKYGCTHNSCLEYEVLLADGTKLTVSNTNSKDLFDSIPGSYGSLGIITAVKMRIVPAKPFVKLIYQEVDSYDAAVSAIQSALATKTDFVDGIMFTKTSGTIMTGSFSDSQAAHHATLHKLTDDWFYLHAQRKTESSDSYEETIPLKDYLFRYDRGAFWVARYGFKIFHVPFNRFTRFSLVGLFKTRTLYSFLAGAKLSQGYVIQDICLPCTAVTSFMEYNDTELGIFPLWLCPLKTDTSNFLSPTYLKTDLVINVGIWGKLDGSYEQFVTANRKLESKVSDLGGRKVLYAHAYYTEAEFWKTYDNKSYTQARTKYRAEAVFPTVYDKTHVGEKYKPSIRKGLLQMFKASSK